MQQSLVIDAPLPADSAPSFVRVLMPLLALALAMALGFTMMGSFATLQEGAKAEMGLSDATLGVIIGFGLAVPLVLFSIPVGILVDRTNRVRLLIVLAVVWTAGTLLTALANGPGLLFAARMMTGIGTTGALTAALSISADLCAPVQRGRALLIVTLGQVLGKGAGFALPGWLLGALAGGAGWFGDIASWRAAHFAMAAVSAVLILPLLFLREPVRREVAAGPHAPFKVVARELWERRAFLTPLFIGQVGVVMADGAALIWAAPILSRQYGQSPADFAGWMGAVVFSTGILGAVLGGVAADLGQKGGRRGGLLYGAVVAAAIGIPSALFSMMPDLVGFAAALGLLLLSGTVTGLITSVALTVLIPNELRGLCIGAFIAFAGLIGFGIAPSLVTLASGAMGGEQYLGKAQALVGVIVSAVAFFAFIVAAWRAPVAATAKPI